jgi:DNA invertase Pin-like site-specific DNA recombinase
MTHQHNKHLTIDLAGTGAAYLRVSTDKQDTERQIESIEKFLTRHNVTIDRPKYWFEDQGWERDSDAVRPEFNKLLAQARAGRIQWVVIDRLDRFGARSSKRLMGYLADLEDYGCRLYDVSGKEWTGEDDATEITAWIGGKTSSREQREKSYRSLGGMVKKARDGEWMGAPPKLGFDVGCFDKATGDELWRVVWEGRDTTGTTTRRGKARPVYHIRRRKVYPDGTSERMDGNVVFRAFKDTQVMRLVPTMDEAKLAAAQKVFHRYATESVTFFGLAAWLNRLGIRNSFGKMFQGRDIRKLLDDEAYLGYPTFNKRRAGRFHRHDVDGGIVDLEPELRGKDTANDPADIIKASKRCYEPLIDRATWDAVQRKLNNCKADQDSRPPRAPKCPDLYLRGLVVCAGCGVAMVSRKDRIEYFCGSWDRSKARGNLKGCSCLRNGVRQETLEGYLNRYLEEVGKRLDLLTQPHHGNGKSKHLTDKLQAEEFTAWGEFAAGMGRLETYLEDYHFDDYVALLKECYATDEAPDKEGFIHKRLDNEESPHKPGFVKNCLDLYRQHFDPDILTADIERLEGEHSALMERWSDLPTPRAREKAKEKFADMEARIDSLKQQQQDAASIVEQHYRHMTDLRKAIQDAQDAMHAESGPQALRHKAEALRGILAHIECEFVATGKYTSDKHAGGPGLTGSRLVAITFLPVIGDAQRYVVPNVEERSHGCR